MAFERVHVRAAQRILKRGIWVGLLTALAVEMVSMTGAFAVPNSTYQSGHQLRRKFTSECPPSRDQVLRSGRRIRGEVSGIVALEHAVEQKAIGLFDKLHHFLDEDHPAWRHSLAMFMESRFVTGGVLALVVVDILASLFILIAEYTDFINPAYSHRTHRGVKRSKRVTLAILTCFVAEQVGHLIAFGWQFFRHPWFVLDLAVVSVSLFLEYKEADLMKGSRDGKSRARVAALGRTICLLRMWKFAAFAFDLLYVGMLQHAMDEQAHQAVTHYIRALESELIKRRIPLPAGATGM